MPIPTQPTRQDIIIQGMKDAGQYTITPSSAAYTDFLATHWETLKTEIWNACRTDRLLEVETCLVAPVGQSSLTLPVDFDSEIALWVYDADTSYRGTAQAGSGTTVTLASTFTSSAAALYGRYIFTIAGTGSGQFQQITNYDDSTKIATLAGTWTTTPDNTTQYLVQVVRFQLDRIDYIRPGVVNWRPQRYMRMGTTLQVFPAGNLIYPILMTYRSNMTRLDDTASPVLLKHFQERRHLWTEGVKTRTMSRYDDDRYEAQKAHWEMLLRQYGAQNVVYSQVEGHR